MKHLPCQYTCQSQLNRHSSPQILDRHIVTIQSETCTKTYNFKPDMSHDGNQTDDNGTCYKYGMSKYILLKLLVIASMIGYEEIAVYTRAIIRRRWIFKSDHRHHEQITPVHVRVNPATVSSFSFLFSAKNPVMRNKLICCLLFE